MESCTISQPCDDNEEIIQNQGQQIEQLNDEICALKSEIKGLKKENEKLLANARQRNLRSKPSAAMVAEKQETCQRCLRIANIMVRDSGIHGGKPSISVDMTTVIVGLMMNTDTSARAFGKILDVLNKALSLWSPKQFDMVPCFKTVNNMKQLIEHMTNAQILEYVKRGEQFILSSGKY